MSTKGFGGRVDLLEDVGGDLDEEAVERALVPRRRPYAPGTKMTFAGLKKTKIAPLFWPICARWPTRRPLCRARLTLRQINNQTNVEILKSAPMGRFFIKGWRQAETGGRGG